MLKYFTVVDVGGRKRLKSVVPGSAENGKSAKKEFLALFIE
jgi:hypothetical protein